MKILIPVEKDQVSVCTSFGRAPYFFIGDTETGNVECIVNSAMNASGGAGIKAAQAVLDTGAEVVITMRCGEKAADVLKAGDIMIYTASGTMAEENMTVFKEGKLVVLESFHSGFHKRQ